MDEKVVHCKRDKHDVYIGRPSKWGNPFGIGKDGTREEVIEKYRDWLMTQPELLAALPELKGKTLGCWCAPQACHGDVLAALANSAPEDAKLEHARKVRNDTQKLQSRSGSDKDRER
jgi:hypothetical protein